MLRYGKKGYLRTIEAVVAIVLILIFIYSAIPRYTRSEPEVPAVVENSQNIITNDIANAKSGSGKYYREMVLDSNEKTCSGVEDLTNCRASVDLNSLMTLVEGHVPSGYDYVFKICDQVSCIPDDPVETPADKTVYMDDIFLSPDNPNRDSKVFRFWIWQR